MNNSAIIIKIEYKYQESDSWTDIPFVIESAKLDQTAKKEPGGWVHTTKAPFKIVKNEASTVEPISTLLLKKAIYRLTDGNGTTYTIGNDAEKARLNRSIVVDGKPGTFNGREIEITWISTSMVAIA